MPDRKLKIALIVVSITLVCLLVFSFFAPKIKKGGWKLFGKSGEEALTLSSSNIPADHEACIQDFNRRLEEIRKESHRILSSKDEEIADISRQVSEKDKLIFEMRKEISSLRRPASPFAVTTSPQPGQTPGVNLGSSSEVVISKVDKDGWIKITSERMFFILKDPYGRDSAIYAPPGTLYRYVLCETGFRLDYRYPSDLNRIGSTGPGVTLSSISPTDFGLINAGEVVSSGLNSSSPSKAKK